MSRGNAEPDTRLLTAKDMHLTPGGPASIGHAGKGEEETGGTRDKKS